jgi:N-formylglutamate deformylase
LLYNHFEQGAERVKPYRLRMPDVRTTSVVFASPHSGRVYPWSFVRRSVLDERTLRSSEDAFVDQLFDFAPKHGAPLLTATYPRAWIDVNRSFDELDPALIEGLTRQTHNPRVASGLGVVPRVVANGRAIYRGKLTRREADTRIRDVWKPWHDAIQVLLDESHALFGEAVLIDCHSMPHEAIESLSHPRGTRPDIVLGDRFGAAAGSQIVDRIEAAFAATGLRVARNAPFAGAFVTQHYGRPSRGQHAVQIEIDRALYMNEQAIRPNGNFQSFAGLMEIVTAEIAEIGRRDIPLAAE